MRLIVVGTGGMAKNHVEHFARIPGVEIVGAVDTDATGHATFARDLGLPSGVFVTALSRRFATDPADFTLMVSEFSACERVGSELIFANGFDP